MLITTQYTKDYQHKADLLSESIAKYWPGRYEPILFEPEQCKSYRKDWPKNRPSYASMQAGEFVDLIDCPEDEIIICLDADTVMQRAFELNELQSIYNSLDPEPGLSGYGILSVFGAYPATPLFQVRNNLGVVLGKVPDKQELKTLHQLEFTASFVIAKKSTFREIGVWFNNNLDTMTQLTGHHAATQLLINELCYLITKVGILPKTFQCGSWYDGCTEEDAKNAIFNHTK